MRDLRGGVLAAVMTAVLLAPVPGHAITRDVTLTGNQFAPAVLDNLQAGDTIAWFWSDGSHHIVAFQGGNFDSGEHVPPAQYSLPYHGGTVRYRCTLHSSLNGSACNGMCGILTSAPVDTEPPVVNITQPQNGDRVVATPTTEHGLVSFPVFVAGTATDNIGVSGGFVRVYDILANGVTPPSIGYAKEYPLGCVGCGSTSATWSITLSLLPGPYTAEVVMSDTNGNRPTTAPRVAFTVV